MNKEFQAQVKAATEAFQAMLLTAPIECLPGDGFNCYFRVRPTEYMEMGYDKKGPDFALTKKMVWAIDDICAHIGIKAEIKGRHVQFWMKD